MQVWTLDKEHEMPLMYWYKRYSINNEEIDKQHKKLIDIFNRLYDICVGKDKTYTLGTVIDELVSYSDYHFKAEEQYMRSIDYREIDKQILEHKYFIQKVSELNYENIKGDIGNCHELILFLSKWILHHVIEEDKKITK